MEERPRGYCEVDYQVDDVSNDELWQRIAKLTDELRAVLRETFRRRRCAACVGPLVEYDDRPGVFFCACCLQEACPPERDGTFLVTPL